MSRRGGKRAVRCEWSCECAACHEMINVGDLMVWWGYGKTGARHLRCTEPGGKA